MVLWPLSIQPTENNGYTLEKSEIGTANDEKIPEETEQTDTKRIEIKAALKLRYENNAKG